VGKVASWSATYESLDRAVAVEVVYFNQNVTSWDELFNIMAGNVQADRGDPRIQTVEAYLLQVFQNPPGQIAQPMEDGGRQPPGFKAPQAG